MKARKALKQDTITEDWAAIEIEGLQDQNKPTRKLKPQIAITYILPDAHDGFFIPMACGSSLVFKLLVDWKPRLAATLSFLSQQGMQI
jgi:hypothetical protein